MLLRGKERVMGIYIPNMDKPKSCWECPFYDSEYPWTCDLFDTYCPIIDIVTCGECKYWSIDEQGVAWCEHAIGGLTEPDDFCSYGERRNE